MPGENPSSEESSATEGSPSAAAPSYQEPSRLSEKQEATSGARPDSEDENDLARQEQEDQEKDPTTYNNVVVAGILGLVLLVFCAMATYFFRIAASSSSSEAAEEEQAQAGDPSTSSSTNSASPPDVGENGSSQMAGSAARRQALQDSIMDARSDVQGDWERTSGQPSGSARSGSRQGAGGGGPQLTEAEQQERQRERQRRAQRQQQLRQNYYSALSASAGQQPPGPPAEAAGRGAGSFRTAGDSASNLLNQPYPRDVSQRPGRATQTRNAFQRASARGPMQGGLGQGARARGMGGTGSFFPSGQGGGAGPGGGAATMESMAARQLQRNMEARNAPEDVAGLTEVNEALPRFVLPKGTIVPIVIESSVSSDLGGQIKMLVPTDVLGRNLEHVLIPAGTEIVSGYGAPSLVGQKRLVIGANRMNLPDGRYVEFRNTNSYGPLGQAGTEGDLDRHLLARFGAVGALAVVSTGLNAASGPAALFGGRRSFRARAAQSGSQQVNQIIAQILEQQIQRQPTIGLKPGQNGALVLNEDINMKRPYYEGRTDQMRMAEQSRHYYAPGRYESPGFQNGTPPQTGPGQNRQPPSGLPERMHRTLATERP